jgi:hypothetical protein
MAAPGHTLQMIVDVAACITATFDVLREVRRHPPPGSSNDLRGLSGDVMRSPSRKKKASPKGGLEGVAVAWDYGIVIALPALL